MGTKLFVGGFPYELTENDLEKVFAACGKVVGVKILVERETRRSRGLAFVQMETEAEAERAIKELNDTEVGHRRIFVAEARPADKPQGGYTGPERRSGTDRRKSAPASGQERRSWEKGRKPGGFPDKKPWKKKPAFGGKPWDKKPASGEKPWDKKPAFGEKPWDKKPAFGEKPWDKKPGEKSWDKKPAFGKKPWDKKPAPGSKKGQHWGPGGPNSGRKPGDFMSKPGGFRRRPGGGYVGH